MARGRWCPQRRLGRGGQHPGPDYDRCVLLAQALIVKDFRFQYVTEYSDALLPWHYSLSAFWVGQGGSLLFGRGLWRWWRWSIVLPPAAL